MRILSAAETGQGNEEMLRFAPDSPWSLIYDMEALFPAKKPQPEPTVNKDDSVSTLILDINKANKIFKKIRVELLCVPPVFLKSVKYIPTSFFF